MSTENSSPEGDTTTDDPNPYARLTVSAFGPVVQEQERDGGVTVATETEAQVERPVRDADDLSTITKDDDPGKAAKAVHALIGDLDDLRLPQSDPPYYDFASNWSITVDGDVADWVDLAIDQAKATNQPSGRGARSALEVLDRLSRDRRNVGPNAHLAAMSLALKEDDAKTHNEILERYRDRFGPDQDSDA